MSISKIFSSIQAVLLMLAGLISLMESPGRTGPDKKSDVLSALDQALVALPLSGSAGQAVRMAARALAPLAVDLLVCWANQSGLFKTADPSSSLP